MKKGKLIVFSGPSGVGKDTILKSLFKKTENLEISVSFTTRPRRKHEIDGKDYHFVTKENFLNKVKNNGMLEYAEYCGNYYGSPEKEINEKLDSGIDIILEIEVQGAMAVIRKKPESLSIFVAPPSLKILKERLIKRGTDCSETIEKRLKEAEKELLFSNRYDYVVINDSIKNCVEEILHIINNNK